jgi:hypothetical protein
MNKMIDVINEIIDECCEGDWNEYSEGDIVRYEYGLEGYGSNLFIGVSENDIKEYVGNGIEIVNEYFNEIKYNLSIKNNELIIEFIYYDVEK